MTSNHKKPKYPVMWNPNLLIDYYSKNNANNNAVCFLITKDQDKEKEEVNKLLVLEKENWKKTLY
jgi:hypothetical protein